MVVDHEHFGPYELQELIGRGGMGEVFRAWDTVRTRTVAVKRLPVSLAQDEAFRKRFRTESEVAARLNDPHVLPIHDFGAIDDRLYIDMRFVAGTDLAGLLARVGPLEPDLAVEVLTQVAGALDSAHGHDLVHRDVKPSNVLLTPGVAGEAPEFAYLTDFGVAQLGGADTGLSTTNTAAGTLDYMAPERFGGRRVSHRVDVYSLGCVLYEMLAGDKPFPAQSMPESMYAHIYLDPPTPSDVRPDLPRGMDEVVARAMAKAPEQRYASCGELAADARARLGQRLAVGSGHRSPSTLVGPATGGADHRPPPAEPRQARQSSSTPSMVPAASTSSPAERPLGRAAGVATLAPEGRPGPGPGGPLVPTQRSNPPGPAGPDSAVARTPAAPWTPGSAPAPREHRSLRVILAACLVAIAISAAAVLVGYVALPGNSSATPAGPHGVPGAVVAPAPAVVPAPASPAPPAAVTPGTYAGRTSGNQMTVAIATKDGKAAAYLCDGKSVEAWMQGTLEGDHVRLRSPKGATLTGTIVGNSAFGEITAGNYGELSFSADLSAPPAGLYEARSGSTRVGWIVLSDGSRVGLSQTNGASGPAPKLDTATGTTTLDGVTVPANPVTGGDTW